MPKINFLLISDSFIQGTNTITDISNNIIELFNVVNEINYSNDFIYKDNDLFSINFLDSKTIGEILYTPNQFLNQNLKNLLIEILKAKNFNNEKHELIGFNKIANSNVIYTLNELITFYKNYIETLIDKDEFVERINTFFKQINFSNNIRVSLNSLDGKFEDFNEVIVNILICLENEFENCMNDSNYELITALKIFSTKLGFETTNEGNANRKKAFMFKFKNANNEDSICCEPHIKMHESKVSGDTKYYVNRIHFHSNHKNFDNKILVGHIGGHL